MNGSNASICACALVTTNLWGIDSHGVLRVPIYVRRLQERAVNANPKPRVIADGGAFRVLNGDNGMGFLVGREATVQATALAERQGIGAVAVRGSNHFGAASLYAELAASRGFIGIVMSNVRPNLVFPGGKAPITGNNPIAVGAPTKQGFPFLLDISMSTVAGGKLLLAAQRGESIPFDWATDKDGRFTDDPQKGFEGFLLPFAGHKGFGLSLAVDLLCGVITGGAFQYAIKSMYAHPDSASETGHVMIAIDPTIVLERSEYNERMAAFYSTVKSAPMWKKESEMLLPGEIEHRSRCDRETNGIPLPARLLEELLELGDELNVEARISEARTRRHRNAGSAGPHCKKES